MEAAGGHGSSRAAVEGLNFDRVRFRGLLISILSTFQIDENYVGEPPKVEVTIENLNDNIKRMKRL